MFFFKNYGLLGQNARNLNYIKGHNDKLARKLADSKLKTKEFLRANKIAVPQTIAIISSQDELNDSIFDNLIPPFVVKPNGGFGGKGILIFNEISSDGKYVTNDNRFFSRKDLLLHFSNIIDGFYSLSGNRDKLIIEKKVELDEEIELLGIFGLPDIRIITFNMVPVMAMLRVPTKESKGKANIHAGACGVGIDIGTGKLTYITSKGNIVKSIPGIGDVRGLKVPNWEKALALAVKVQQVTKIGYIGSDIVLDKSDGPLILEINVRPGLDVQLANLAPLKERLEKVEGIFVNSVEKGVRIGRDLFSGDIEEKIKNISGKKVVGAREYLHFSYNDKDYKYLADIKPSNSNSYIDKEFVLNVLKIDEKLIDKGYLKFETKLLGETKKTKFIIKDLSGVNILLGLNALKGFLIDPFKYKKGDLPVGDNDDYKKGKNIAIKRNYEELLAKIDKQLISIDKKLLILKYFTPTNLRQEKQKFIESNGEYIPKFEYSEFKLDLNNLEKDLEKIEISDIPLASIYKRKKDEIKNKINLFKAFKSGKSTDITAYSKKVYGDISIKNLEYAKELLDSKKEINQEEEFLSFDEIKDFIKKFNHIYNIGVSLVRGQKTARFVMKGDSLYIRDQAKVGKKELRSIVAHEIEGHYLRKINGRKIVYSIFEHGTAGYLEIDEGIAVFNQNRFLGIHDRKFYSIYERYYFLSYALSNSYSSLLKKMKDYYDNDLDKVFTYIARLKRGMKSFSDEGIFVKDSVYLNGYLKLEEFIDNGGKFEELYIGKISIDDLDEIKNSYFIKFDFSELITPFFIRNK